ncbi:Ltp family lipoprotein [Phycicoccus sp.]|uniref:Ltp family lipoprotein n=1 Tax=Phycicoccus sp. TaxID=1902410 RepID=UPI002BA463D5|nr:Ltp family lipoprotein [Phycicoccus sp.]HMM96280.1 Ltp family lipoprotein [Phycicoccus sp.]
MTNSPAGWYPQDDGRQRYWDGQKWTEHFAPGAPQQTSGPTVPTAAMMTAGGSAAPRPWFKKKRVIIPAGLVGLVIFASALGAAGSDDPKTPTALDKPTTSSSASTPSTASPTAAATSAAPSPSQTSTPTPTVKTAAPKPTVTKPAAPTLTVAQENAKGRAESYLEMTGFSQKGLIEQLKFEGYATKDITAALATMTVNWNAEAAEKARSYMDMTHFSRKGLIEQLVFEGFTSKQAAYGAKAVGL